MQTTTSRQYIRYRTHTDAHPRWGECIDDRVHELDMAPWHRAVAATGHQLGRDEVILLAPAEPTKILALGYNYKDLFSDEKAKARADEVHFTAPGFEPILFLKGPNALAAPDERIVAPENASEIWVEVELAVVIGSRLTPKSTKADVAHGIFGYTIGNDVSALNVLGRDWHLARSKSRDGFCPLGPVLVQDFDDRGRALASWINGKPHQKSNTDQRVLSTVDSVHFVAQIMTLEPGSGRYSRNRNRGLGAPKK
jgi:2-keto-4-pentenoate hydratase/2-oxohepta-3-ene-1,7-dioic acid hydratase in catechol pathway